MGASCDARLISPSVVGEGGNLGVTQRGRIEFARSGGRIYTDAIDNAGGVDCSDHEVNIKILLDKVVLDGDLTAKQRNELLELPQRAVRWPHPTREGKIGVDTLGRVWDCRCVSFGEIGWCAWIAREAASSKNKGRIQLKYDGPNLNVVGNSSIFGDFRVLDSDIFAINDVAGPANQPPNEIRLRTRLMRWDGISTWQQCRTTNYVQNSVTTWGLGMAPNWGTAPCGTGLYENFTDGFVLEGGAWRGGTVFSGYFNWLLPLAAAGADAAALPPGHRLPPAGSRVGARPSSMKEEEIVDASDAPPEYNVSEARTGTTSSPS
jgi:hypothetical protein